MIREEVNKISLNKNELTFSKEIAETLGIESAVILNLYKENSLDDISSMQGLLESVKKNISFFDDQTISTCLAKLIKFNLLKIDIGHKNNHKSIAVGKIPNKGFGKTINDRLLRASKF